MRMGNRRAFKSGCVAMMVLGEMLVGCGGTDGGDNKALDKEDGRTGEKVSKEDKREDGAAEQIASKLKASVKTEVDEAAGKPHKCRLVVEMSPGNKVTLTGYGASLQEAREVNGRLMGG